MQNGNNPPYLQLEPTVQTEIVTTTKRTIINYPQIPIMRPKSPQQLFSLNTKKYPLSRAPLPPETANFTFNLPDGHKATYNSNESTVDNKGKCKLLDDCHPKKKLKEDDIPISGPLRSPLPSPHASPRNDSTSDSSTITIDSDSPPNLGESSTMPVLLSIPHLMSIYPTLPSETQSHLLLHLLRLSSINTIRQVNNFIKPALQKDFLSQLPPELSSLILSYLNLRELTRSASVSKTWRRIVDNDRCAWKLAGIKEGLWFGDEDSIATARHEALTITNKISTKNHNSNYDNNNEDISSNEDNCSTDAPRTPLTPPPISNTSGNIVSPARSSFMARCHPYKQILRKRYVVRNNWFYQDPKSFEFARHGQNVVTCLQFDSDKIVTASDGDDNSIDVSCTRTGRLRKRLRGHTGGVWALQYVGDTLVSGATDRTVRVWDIPSGRCTHVLLGHYSTVRCLAIIMPKFNPKLGVHEPPYPIIVSGSRDFTIRIWRLPSPTRDRPWSFSDEEAGMDNPWALRLLSGHTNAVRAVAGDGKILVSGSYDHTVRIWNTVTGHADHVLRGHNNRVYSVVLDAPRNRCASGSFDGSVKIWSVDKGEQLLSLEGHTNLVGLLGLNSNSLISAAADSNIRIWDLSSGECKHVLEGHQGPISCMAHDEQKIISGSEGTLKLWSIRDGSLKKDLLTGIQDIWQVSTSERYLVAASKNISRQTFINVFDYGPVGDEIEENIEPCRLNWEPQWWMPLETSNSCVQLPYRQEQNLIENNDNNRNNARSGSLTPTQSSIMAPVLTSSSTFQTQSQRQQSINDSDDLMQEDIERS